MGRIWPDTTGAGGGHAPRAGGAPSRKNPRPKNCSQSLELSGKANAQLLATGMAVSVVKKPEMLLCQWIKSSHPGLPQSVPAA